MKQEEVKDPWHCKHCDAETIHLCRYSGHERDSSRDWRKCLVCEWECFGITGEYEPPTKWED
jgi:hypothetical protein